MSCLRTRLPSWMHQRSKRQSWRFEPCGWSSRMFFGFMSARICSRLRQPPRRCPSRPVFHPGSMLRRMNQESRQTKKAKGCVAASRGNRWLCQRGRSPRVALSLRGAAGDSRWGRSPRKAPSQSSEPDWAHCWEPHRRCGRRSRPAASSVGQGIGACPVMPQPLRELPPPGGTPEGGGSHRQNRAS